MRHAATSCRAREEQHHHHSPFISLAANRPDAYEDRRNRVVLPHLHLAEHHHWPSMAGDDKATAPAAGGVTQSSSSQDIISLASARSPRAH